ncbi:MAG TPA: AAA family ATPase [Actinomycetes bacterium]
MQREIRKIVSVVFSDVAGSTALAEQLDPESLRRAMTRYFEVARRVHQRHGGVVEKFIGDAVMAVFGIPHVHEDDALRAVRAAWELRAELAALNRELERELGVALHVRTGVNTGLVLAGDEQQGHAFVGGETVNVAARLERAADAGEVLVGEATHRLVADAVTVQPVAPFVPRGKTAPVAAFRLLEVAPDAPGLTRRLETPLLGRTGELDALDRLLDRTAGGTTGELVTVLGPAGVGKTRLLRAFAERARERALVLTGSCPAYGGSAAVEVVGQLLAQARAAGDGTPPPEVSIDAADPRSLFGGVRRLLEALAETRPVVVLLDDVHRAEQELLDLVEYLHAFAGAGLLLVVAARPEPARWPGWNLRAAGTVLELEPLAEAEAAELAAHLLGPDRAADGIARQVAAWAEGNPLFVEQLVRDLADREDPGLLGRAGSWPVPPAVEALVAVELDRLTADERAVLELASVVGRVFDLASVAALAPPPLAPRLGGVLLALARRNLLRVAGREHGEDAFLFRHRLLRDAAYQAIPKRERAILHVRAADRVRGEAADQHLGKAYRYLAQLAGDEPPPPAPVVRRLRSASAG